MAPPPTSGPSQATRCPACQTVFRVVADQLRVSDGWVRCGRCSEVFDATLQMMAADGSWMRQSEESAPPLPSRAADPPQSAPLPLPHRARQDGLVAPSSAFAGSGPAPETRDTERLAAKVAAAMTRSLGTSGPVRDGPGPAPVQAPAVTPRPQAPPDEPAADDYVNPYVDPFAGPLAKDAPRYGPLPKRPAAAGMGHAPADRPDTPAGTPAQASPGSWMHDSSLPEGAVAADPFASAPGWTPRKPIPAPTPAPAPAPTRQAAPKPVSKSVPEDPELADFQPSTHGRAPRAEPRFGDHASPARGGHRDFEPSLYEEPASSQAWAATEAVAPLESSLRRAAGAGSAKPEFMQRAEKEQRWRQPHMRMLLMAGVLAGVLALVTQMSVAYRDLVAARFPAAKPWLQGACKTWGCTVQPARAIESLAVESSGLVRVDKTHLYKLQVTLRNRASLDLALPALDITFTDSKGAVISRKVLTPADLGSTMASLGAGREVTLQTTLQGTGPSPELVAGYTVELFYP